MSEEVLNQLLTGWERAYVVRCIIGLIGCAIAWASGSALVRSRRGWIGAGLCLLVGLVAVAFAVVPEQVITTVISTEYILRVRVIFGFTSVVVLLVTFDSVRRHHLAERYALLWVATGCVLLFVVLFPGAVDLLRAATGLEFGSALVALAFIFLVLVAFHFSLAMSSFQSNQTKLAQRIAILQTQLDEFRADSRAAGKGDSADAEAGKTMIDGKARNLP